MWCILHRHKYFFCKLQCLLDLEAKKCKQKSKMWMEKQNTFDLLYFLFFLQILFLDFVEVFSFHVSIVDMTKVKDVNKKKKTWSQWIALSKNYIFCIYVNYIICWHVSVVSIWLMADSIKFFLFLLSFVFLQIVFLHFVKVKWVW